MQIGLSVALTALRVIASAIASKLLMETNSAILLENGSFLLLE